MIQVNEYFEGKVKSLTLDVNGEKVTSGVMAPGEYEFSTGKKEIMTVTAGAMDVKLPGESSFKTYKRGEHYTVPGNSKFQLKITSDCAYICEFKD
ncbi:MAG: pyrimidine/purine nucleoside phosphorylase [Spirochaetia bacterium]|nr:pyrimidine/purine nucleoside phosphorylase [Spirochaetia bacterium]